MNERKLVVIGGDAAGMTAASKVRRVHPDRFAPQLMPMPDKDMADPILEQMTELQVNIFPEEKLMKFEIKNEYI
jgi:pyruvate/2-oxoglutarate dehydrogenase complex dihydrolipoamide dehydrogenase (E3) component